MPYTFAAMRTATILLLIVAIVAQSSCTKTKSSNPLTLPGNVITYVAGTAGDTAVYYVNGKEYQLSSGNSPASANGIALSGSDVYVAGYESNGTLQIAKYWKNGTAVILSDTTANVIANAIALIGADVYVAGTIYTNTASAAALWKNGSLTLLNATGHGGGANALLASGTDVYVAGYDSTAGQVTACYWKNGVIVTLPDSLNYARAQSIAINGTDVYLAGWDRSADGFSFIGPRCWKNGTTIPLATSTKTAAATSITIASNTIFITGQDNGNSIYWQNGSENLLTDGNLGNAIAINNGDIYVAGTSTVLAGSFTSALFWRDGVPIPLSANPSAANAIVITN